MAGNGTEVKGEITNANLWKCNHGNYARDQPFVSVSVTISKFYDSCNIMINIFYSSLFVYEKETETKIGSDLAKIETEEKTHETIIAHLVPS